MAFARAPPEGAIHTRKQAMEQAMEMILMEYFENDSNYVIM